MLIKTKMRRTIDLQIL